MSENAKRPFVNYAKAGWNAAIEAQVENEKLRALLQEARSVIVRMRHGIPDGVTYETERQDARVALARIDEALG